MYISGIEKDSVVDGEGIRVTIFISGCNHNCKNCHNPKTHNFAYGKKYNNEIRDIIFDNINPLLHNGITLSGGDPMYSAKEVLQFVKDFKIEFYKSIKENNMDIWLYTGFVWEYIIKNEDMFNLAKECDVIVDGLYDESKKDFSLSFRGSTNQRFIDVKKTINSESIINYTMTY
jgi:anaerobic ribonucleoside-triphosphate reductase activating protein